ncbi:Mor transcription activator family protein [Aeromonas hydrophila]|uniref:Mor transcription activator family protein n=1 Tax=Aeromonas hydrophila TaxID=644 RepID=UPI0038CFE78C
MPTGDHLKAPLRDRAIWVEFNGRNVDQFARKHGLLVLQMYSIIATQSKLGTHKLQGAQFY